MAAPEEHARDAGVCQFCSAPYDSRAGKWTTMLMGEPVFACRRCYTAK